MLNVLWITVDSVSWISRPAPKLLVLPWKTQLANSAVPNCRWSPPPCSAELSVNSQLISLWVPEANRALVGAVELDVVGARRVRIEPHGVRNDKGYGLGLQGGL